MTSRERLLNVFNGQKADRVPVTLFVTDSDIEDGPPNCVLDGGTGDAIEDLIGFHEILGIDIMLRISVDAFEPAGFDQESGEWENVWEVSDDKKAAVHRIITPGGELKEAFNLEGEDFHGDFTKSWMKLRNVRTEWLIKSRGDLELIEKYRPKDQVYDFSNIREAEERLGDRGIVLPRVPSGVYNYAVGLRKLEDMLMAPMLEPDFYKAMMEFCVNDVVRVGKQIAVAGGDVMRVVGNFANSGMIGDKFYMEHVFSYEKEYIDALASCGKKVLFHNCGQCNSLLEVYKKMLDGQAFESLSSPGSGGDVTDLGEARKAIGPNVVMVGNFDQVNLLKNGTKDDIRKETEKIFEQVKGDGRFVFSTSDSIIPGTPRENIFALAEYAVQCAEKKRQP